MANYIIIGILILVIIFALRGSLKHMKGEGGCCGGGSRVKKQKQKTLSSAIIGKKKIYIEGMHCDNCKYRVEDQLNQLEGVVALVDLKKNSASISMSQEVSDQELKNAVAKAGFQVTGIEEENV